MVGSEATNDAAVKRLAVARGGGFVLLVAVIGGAIVGVGGGCGPTRTAGTRGVAARDLAIVSIPQFPDESPVKLDTVRFNHGDAKNDNTGGDEAYAVGRGKDFYLLPGRVTAGFDLVGQIPDASDMPRWVRWTIPNGGKIKIPGPRHLPLGIVAAGKRYELALPSAEQFNEFFEQGTVSLLREKEK